MGGNESEGQFKGEHYRDCIMIQKCTYLGPIGPHLSQSEGKGEGGKGGGREGKGGGGGGDGRRG